MYPVKPSDKLCKVTRYHLERGDFMLIIEVCWYLTGPDAGKFKARPLDKDSPFHVSAALWGEGGSEADALRDCLKKISHLDFQQVYSLP